MASLKVGQSAPRFSLQDKDGKVHSLDKPAAEYTVLYFYPKDDTPGCTLEAKEFSHLIEKFTSRNVRVVGVSGGDEKTKAKFCAKHSLNVPLVSDTDFKVAKSYGAYGMKKFMGRTFQGIFRKTFLVDKAGKIAHIFDTVKPEGHAEEVLAAIDELSKKGGVRKIAATPDTRAKKVAPKRSVTKKTTAPKKVMKKVVKAKPLSKVTRREVAPKLSSRRGVKKASRKK